MKKFARLFGILIGSLIGVLLVLGAVMYALGNARLNKVYDFPPSNLVIPTDAASIANGKHRAETLCEGCHGKDLSGVDKWFNAGPIGTIDSANLTAGEGGVGREYTSDEDFVRAIRHGIDPAGKPIFMTAVYATSNLSDEDLAAIIAYIKTVPPVDHVHQERYFTPLARILLTAGVLGDLPVEAVSHAVKVSAPTSGTTPEYGKYLVDTHDCRVCHGADLNGGPFPDPTITKISPNLTPGGELAAWGEADFMNALRTGKTPAGHDLNPEFMPWEIYKNFTDDELKAIFLYLQSVPKLPQYTE